MNKRQHRAAVQAKRGDIELSRHRGRGYRVDDLTDEDRVYMDTDRERQKYDPVVQQQKLHDDIEHQQRMLRIMGSSM